MRPESIRKFDLFYLGSIALSLVVVFLGYDSALQQAQAQAAGSGVEVGSGMLVGSLAFGLLLALLLWYLTSRKGFAIAKWILVLLFLLGLVGLPGAFAGGLTTLEIISLAGTALQAIAIWYLFQPDASAWFKGENAGVGDARD